jgi:hypothetical protein
VNFELCEAKWKILCSNTEWCNAHIVSSVRPPPKVTWMRVGGRVGPVYGALQDIGVFACGGRRFGTNAFVTSGEDGRLPSREGLAQRRPFPWHWTSTISVQLERSERAFASFWVANRAAKSMR